MDLVITNNRTCAGMPGHRLCVDYQLPAIQQIFAKLLEKHPLITEYNDCHFSSISSEQILCSSASHTVSATLKLKKSVLGIRLEQNRNRNDEHLWLDCEEHRCNTAGSNDAYYYFARQPEGNCVESLKDKEASKYVPVPCDGKVSLFDEYLKLSPVTLEAPQPVTPPTATSVNPVGAQPIAANEAKTETPQPVAPPVAQNAKPAAIPPATAPVTPPVVQNAKPAATPPAAAPVTPPTATNGKTASLPPTSANEAKADTPQQAPSPTAPAAKPAGAPASGNSSSQSSSSFSTLQTGLGAAATMLLAYKAFKERQKIGESLRNKEIPQLKARTQGQAASAGSTQKASTWRPLGYAGAAVASGAFTYYTIRA